jgi:polysaccharide biosynthesis/export protein
MTGRIPTTPFAAGNQLSRPPAARVALVPAGRAQTFGRIAPGLARCLLAWALAASCWTAFGQAGGASGAQSGAQTGASGLAGQSSEAPAPPANSLSTPLGNQSMLYPGEDFQLGAGDLIFVRLFMQPDYQATVRIDLDGNVKLPFIGSVNLSGLTVRAAQTLIGDRLRMGEFYKNPEVTIQVIDTVNGSAMVTGEVRAIVPVATERSLKDVLLTAGGLPASASHTVKIVRLGLPDPIVVDLGTDLASSTTANIPVLPHDIIQITRASVVYVLGAFSHQGAVPLDQSSPLTLLQLAALSGGINFEGSYNDLRIIRTVGKDRKVVDIDIKKVRDGRAPDPVLQANDIVFLPTNSMKAALKSVGAGGVLGLVSILIAAHAY